MKCCKGSDNIFTFSRLLHDSFFEKCRPSLLVLLQSVAIQQKDRSEKQLSGIFPESFRNLSGIASSVSAGHLRYIASVWDQKNKIGHSWWIQLYDGFPVTIPSFTSWWELAGIGVHKLVFLTINNVTDTIDKWPFTTNVQWFIKKNTNYSFMTLLIIFFYFPDETYSFHTEWSPKHNKALPPLPLLSPHWWCKNVSVSLFTCELSVVMAFCSCVRERSLFRTKGASIKNKGYFLIFDPTHPVTLLKVQSLDHTFLRNAREVPSHPP